VAILKPQVRSLSAKNDRIRYRTRDEARADVFDYIECFCDPGDIASYHADASLGNPDGYR
jgi:hypothetical protein